MSFEYPRQHGDHAGLTPPVSPAFPSLAIRRLELHMAIQLGGFQSALDRRYLHGRLQPEVTPIGPFTARFAMEMLDLRLVLADQNIIGKRRIELLVAGEFDSAIKSLGSLRKDLDHCPWIEQHVPVVVQVLLRI